MSILDWFIKPQIETGALTDDRSSGERDKDYVFDEIVKTPDKVQWTEKKQDQWRKFPLYDQNGSTSCVAQTVAKLLGIILFLRTGTYVHFSATDIFQRRKNKPDQGMYGIDALEIARRGVTLESLVPSQSLTDKQMDSYEVEDYKRMVGDVFKIDNYVTTPVGDIDLIASIIQKTKKGVMLWFYFTRDEWNEVPTINKQSLGLFSPNVIRHSVTATDFTLYNGEKALIIEDTWGNKPRRRIITERFMLRNYFGAYPVKFVFEPSETVIVPVIISGIKKAKKGDRTKNVERLQEYLIHMGMFPRNVQVTGYYGSITAKAVLEWQLSRKEHFARLGVNEYELRNLRGNYFGEKSVQVLNS